MFVISGMVGTRYACHLFRRGLDMLAMFQNVTEMANIPRPPYRLLHSLQPVLYPLKVPFIRFLILLKITRVTNTLLVSIKDSNDHVIVPVYNMRTGIDQNFDYRY